MRSPLLSNNSTAYSHICRRVRLAEVLLSSLLGAYYYRIDPMLKSIEPWANLRWWGLAWRQAQYIGGH